MSIKYEVYACNNPENGYDQVGIFATKKEACNCVTECVQVDADWPAIILPTSDEVLPGLNGDLQLRRADGAVEELRAEIIEWKKLVGLDSNLVNEFVQCSSDPSRSHANLNFNAKIRTEHMCEMYKKYGEL